MGAVCGASDKGQIQCAIFKMTAVTALIENSYILVTGFHSGKTVRNHFPSVVKQGIRTKSGLTDYLACIGNRDCQLYHFVCVIKKQRYIDIHIIIVFIDAVLDASFAVFFFKEGFDAQINIAIFNNLYGSHIAE